MVLTVEGGAKPFQIYVCHSTGNAHSGMNETITGRNVEACAKRLPVQAGQLPALMHESKIFDCILPDPGTEPGPARHRNAA